VGRAARDDEASAPCIECRSITQPSSRITSTPARGLRGWRGPAPPLALSRRRGVVVRNLHCGRSIATGGGRRR
jgi:hypothetical protein